MASSVKIGPHLSAADLHIFRTLGVEREIEAGRVIAETRTANSILVLLKGWAAKTRQFRNGQRQLLQVHLPADVCNIDCLYDEHPVFCVSTLDNCVFLTVPKVRLLETVNDNPAMQQVVSKLIIQENGQVLEHLSTLGRRSSLQRLAFLFIDLIGRLELRGGATANSFSCPLKQADMADYLGMSVVHLNRTLRELFDSNVIKRSGRLYEVVDRPGLSQLALAS